MNKEKLIDWCWTNLEFNNCPETWEDTEIIDIINGYNGNIHKCDGKILSYAEIRNMFIDGDDEE